MICIVMMKLMNMNFIMLKLFYYKRFLLSSKYQDNQHENYQSPRTFMAKVNSKRKMLSKNDQINENKLIGEGNRQRTIRMNKTVYNLLNHKSEEKDSIRMFSL